MSWMQWDRERRKDGLRGWAFAAEPLGVHGFIEIDDAERLLRWADDHGAPEIRRWACVAARRHGPYPIADYTELIEAFVGLPPESLMIVVEATHISGAAARGIRAAARAALARTKSSGDPS